MLRTSSLHSNKILTCNRLKIRKFSTPAPSSEKVTSLPPAGPKVSNEGGKKGSGMWLVSVLLATPIGTALMARQNPDWTPFFMEGRKEWKDFQNFVGVEQRSQPKTGMESSSFGSAKSKLKQQEVKETLTTKSETFTKKLSAQQSLLNEKTKGPSRNQEDENNQSQDKVSSLVAKSQTLDASKKSTTSTLPKSENTSSAMPRTTTTSTKSKVSSSVSDAKSSKEKSIVPTNSNIARKEDLKEEKTTKSDENLSNEKDLLLFTKNQLDKSGQDLKKSGQDLKKSGQDLQKSGQDLQKSGQDLTKSGQDVKSQEKSMKTKEFLEKEKEIAAALESDLAELERKANTIHRKTVSGVLQDFQKDSSAFQDSAEAQALADLQKLNADQLRDRITDLIKEMKSRAKWEAYRIVELLRKVEKDSEDQTCKVLNEAKEKYDALLVQEKRLLEEHFSEQNREEIDEVHKKYLLKVEDAVEFHKKKHTEALQRKMEAQIESIRSQHEAQFIAKVEELSNAYHKERQDRINEMETLRCQVEALNNVFESSANYEAFSNQVHKISVAALALANKIEKQAPLQNELETLRQAGKGDYLIESVLESLPTSLVNHGAPSLSQLEDRFFSVRRSCRRAALVPENTGLVGHAFGYALSFLMLPPYGPIGGNDPEAILSRIEHELKQGNLTSVLDEANQLKGLPAQTISDFVNDVRSRIVVDQAIAVVKSHVTLLAASCS